MNTKRVETYLNRVEGQRSLLRNCDNIVAFSAALEDIRERLSFCKHEKEYPQIIADVTLNLLSIGRETPYGERLGLHITELISMEELYQDNCSAERLITQCSDMEEIDLQRRVGYIQDIFNNMPSKKKEKYIYSSIVIWQKELDEEQKGEHFPNPKIVLTAYNNTLEDCEQGGRLAECLNNHGLSVSFEYVEGYPTLDVFRVEGSSVE